MRYEEDAPIEAEPLREALAGLREIDSDYIALRDDADEELDHRMRTLRLTLAALEELTERREVDDPTPRQVRDVMAEIATEFAFDPQTLLVMAEAAREFGDDEDAATLERAYQWHEARWRSHAASNN